MKRLRLHNASTPSRWRRPLARWLAWAGSLRPAGWLAESRVRVTTSSQATGQGGW